MNVTTTERGLELIEHHPYQSSPGYSRRLVQASSAIDPDRENPLSQPPGSSYLWFGEFHLDRKEVAELAAHLQAWLATGSLRVEGGDGKPSTTAR